ncbi:MAG: cation-transporting P-type ATPase [Candidatus Rokubacteria bacterium]|nr:cation-transporting P-type ATPase [Candidatus Rokubacteria bacterium]
MATTARSLALSPFLTGDPVRLEPAVASLGDLLASLGLEGLERAGLLPLAPRVALLHSLPGGIGGVTLRWVQLPQAATLAEGAEPVEVVVVLVAPIREGARALCLVSRLRACLRDPAVVDRARSATTREGLVKILAAAEATAGESPLSGDEVLSLLGSGTTGLTAAEALRRLEQCGPNRLERVRRRPLALRFVEQFWSFFALLLWVGGGFAFLAGMPELGWAIFAVIVVNGVFSFFQEYRAERAVEALQGLLPHAIAVLRAGGEARLPTSDLVPGDLVRIEEGDQVPADGQLLSAEGLRVDQSPLTGESHPVFKLPAITDERESVPRLERHELVFAGTGVVAGSGTLLVTATGMGTEIGAIAQLTQAVVEEPSPLQREMRRVTRIVTFLAVSFGVSFFVLGVMTGVLPLGEGFLFALGVIVANVPEGLLPTLTLALALGVQRMVRQRSLVKRLSAVETLGATTVICTDKTGTLTQNRMAARFIWVSGVTLAAGEVRGDGRADVRELLEASALASQATLEHGDPTEMALLVAAVKAGVDPEKVRRAHDLLAPYPFDSFRKRMTLVRAADAGATAYVKGAPKETLALCDTIRWEGRTQALTDDLRRQILADHDRLAAEGLRILAVASRPLSDTLVRASAGAVERELTFLGLVALWDPPRAEVKEAVALCRSAGVRVVMVTGDYGLTAQAIARQIGLPVEKVITGEEVERLSPDALRGLLAEGGILFARTSPAHKLSIVKGLKALGEVVAVTGDGVNDAPALKAADIGVAMGKRGSEVAKEAAVMVITDDNFASIVAAVRQGRGIYANMGKFITYIFASNVPELVPFLAFVFLGIPLPLTVMQILAVDLGTDLLPALALGAEAPEPGVMDRPPRPKSQRLLGAERLLRAYAFLGVAEAALSLLAFFWTYWVAGWRPGLPMARAGGLYRRATTMTLAGIVATQVGNVFACRTDRESVFRVGLFSNRLVLLGIAAEIGILLVLILVPPFPYIFGLAPLAFEEWRLLLLFPPAVLLLEEGRKWIVRQGAGPRRKLA